MKVKASSKGEFLVGSMTKENTSVSMCCVRAMIRTEGFKVTLRVDTDGRHYNYLWVTGSKSAAQRLCDLLRGMSHYDYSYAVAKGLIVNSPKDMVSDL